MADRNWLPSMEGIIERFNLQGMRVRAVTGKNLPRSNIFFEYTRKCRSSGRGDKATENKTKEVPQVTAGNAGERGHPAKWKMKRKTSRLNLTW